MLRKKLLCTIGPASANKKTLCRFEELGVNLFRINLSHTRIEDLEDQINLIRQHSKVPICLDTEGAQIRTGKLSIKEEFLKDHEIIELVETEIEGAVPQLPLYPHFVLEQLTVGDLLTIDFDSVMVQIVAKNGGKIQARVISPGWVGSNKAVNLLRSIHLPALTAKDEEAIAIGLRLGITNFALSFANRKEDVDTIKKLTQGKANIIAKIESKEGYQNLDAILQSADSILIDRGDLSREISISLIPFFQKKIIEHANRAGKEVYVATNLLESMRENRTPTRAEVNDVMNALILGADGLVLAAETAIGKLPIESATMVVKLINQFRLSQQNNVSDDQFNAFSMLVEPHGGQLVERWEKDPDWTKINKLPRLNVAEPVIMDAEQIGVGTYSPLEGFMTREEIHSVLDTYRLPNHIPWTLPIVLQKSREEIRQLKEGQTVALVSEADNEIYATLAVEDIYQFSFETVCQKWFGTLNPEHPGVERLKKQGDCFIGGKITLLKRRTSPYRIYELTPRELRHIFESKGWSRIVGFHTRNVAHRGHETIQKLALETTHCDGLLISPVIGEKKKGDFTSDILLNGYQLLIDKGFLPTSKVVLGALATYSRYSGPREAVFTAICRKNFGCSHFIVGRDHTGVGKFYAPKASQELFDTLGDVGITTVQFDEVYFCDACQDYAFECAHPAAQRRSLSGSQVRNFLKAGEKPPVWLMREEVSDMVLEKLHIQKEDIFIV